MIRGTTPTVKFILKDKEGQAVGLSSYECFVTMKDYHNKEITFTNERIQFNQDASFQILMTQEETLAFNGMKIQVQLRAKKDGLAIASNIGRYDLNEILKGGVI